MSYDKIFHEKNLNKDDLKKRSVFMANNRKKFEVEGQNKIIVIKYH